METTEVKPKLSKHISAAVNHIQKLIDKKEAQILKLNAKRLIAEHEAAVLRDEIMALKEHISKLTEE